MYYFLNSFSFEKHKDDLTYNEIINTLSNLALLINEFNLNKLELIIHSTLSMEKLNDLELKSYIPKLDKNLRVTLLAKLTKSKPFCSNTYEDYHEDETIVLANCKEELSQKDVICNFLGCAMFLKAPIVTPELFCCNSGFSNDQIKIICDRGHSENLKNYHLSNYTQIISDYKQNQQNNINNWDEYFNFINDNFMHIEILQNCTQDIKVYTFESLQGKSIREDIEKFEKFIAKNGANPSFVDYKELGSHVNPESDTRLKRKKNKLTKKDKKGNDILMSWHTRIGSFRLYFYFDSNKIYFNFFTTKIP
jgi:hypothetical protein